MSKEIPIRSIDTTCVQGGYQPKGGEPRTPPLIQSTTFKYASSAEMGALFDLEASGYFYTRLQNPTNDQVAAKICELEGGAAAMLTSSGQAASFFSLFNICGAGDHIVASSAIYGGTYNLLAVTMRRMGIECSFVHPDCSPEELNAAFRPTTKALFAESLANPALIVLDFDKFARAANRHGVPLIVDNTFPTPVNCRPFELGAHIVVHSTTKYMDGHATSVGGAIVDSGSFDWQTHADKYPGLTTPDKSYHGVVYAERFGAAAYITKATVQLMRDLGSIPSPANSFYLNTHLESLAVRMARHCASAQQVAASLAENSHVSWVRFPGLPGDPYYELAQRYMPRGTCGVISFGVKGGREKVGAFTDSLRLASIATHVADARTCVLYPAGTTHRQMSDEELVAAGVGPDLIRLSVGLEAPADLIADIEQALDQTT
jgi:O-acetylhomoserine (thiol)-lyase